MLLVLTVAVLLCGVYLAWAHSTENTLATLLIGVGTVVLFPLAVIAGIVAVTLSSLSGILPVVDKWGTLIGGFVNGAYGIPSWYWMGTAVVLWFIAIFQIGDSETSTDQNGEQTDDFKEITDIRGIGPQVADGLRNAGFHTVEDIKAGSESDISEIPGIPSVSAARIKAEVGDIDGKSDRRVEDSDGEPSIDTSESRSLEDISGIGGRKADALRDAGFESIEDVKKATQDELTETKGVGNVLAARIKANVGDMAYEESTGKTEGESDTAETSNRSRSTKTTGKRDTGGNNTSPKRLENLQQSADSLVEKAMTDPFAYPAATRRHLKRGRTEYGWLVERAEKADNDDILASSREALQTIEMRLDAMNTIIDSLEIARKGVSTDGEPTALESASRTELKMARDSYETALEEAEKAGFDTDTLEREYEAVYAGLEQRRPQELTAAIEEVRAELGYVPTLTEVVERRDVEKATYRDVFGSWETALEASNIDFEGEIIEDLRAVEDSTDGSLDEETYQHNGRYDLSRVHSSFGSWSDALDSAFDKSNVTTDEDGKAVVVTEPTREEYITVIQRVANESDRVVKSTDIRNQSPYSVNEVVGEFGSWQDALDAAGVDNESRLLEELQRVADEVGHRPSTTDMNQHGQVSASMYADYFGTYTAAVDRAFGTGDNDDPTDNESSENTVAEDSAENSLDDVPEVEDEADDEKSSFVTIGGITEDGRIGRPIAVQVCEFSDRSWKKKQAKLLVEDLNGDRCWLNIWKKHDITVSWKTGHWYVLEQARGKHWTDGRGETGRKLSSTTDLQVTHVGINQPNEAIDDSVETETGSDSEQESIKLEYSEDETTDEKGEPDNSSKESDEILDELIGEFDELTELESS